MTSLFDYDYLFQLITQNGKNLYGPGFCIHELDRPVVRKLIAYVLRDEVVAKEENIQLDKGILLTGNIGCGKTSLVNLMRSISKVNFKPVVKSCREISIEFGRKGYEIITKYSTNAFHPYSAVPREYCFDDLGLESIVNSWGDKWNVMVEILLLRYDLFISHKMLTHATTNLNVSELEDIYGNRLRSRMRAMFNLISFDPATEDKRK